MTLLSKLPPQINKKEFFAVAKGYEINDPKKLAELRAEKKRLEEQRDEDLEQANLEIEDVDRQLAEMGYGKGAKKKTKPAKAKTAKKATKSTNARRRRKTRP